MRIALVVAMDLNGVIGDKGGLIWRISDDLKWFKKMTLGKPVVMGRKTFDSIGKALPGRENIVITRSKSWTAPGVVSAPGVDEALEIGVERARAEGADEICVIGGAEIYAQTIERAARIYLTRVEAKLEGDAHFPAIEAENWTETPAGGCEVSPRNQYFCRFFILDRLKSSRND